MCFPKHIFSFNHSTTTTRGEPRARPGTRQTSGQRRRSDQQPGGGGGGTASSQAASSSSLSSGPHSRASKESSGSTSAGPTSSVDVGAKQLTSHGAMVFRLKELNRATDHFSHARRVGDSRSVFRASLEGMDVVITQKNYEGGDMDFPAELKLVSSIHHANIVKLVGGCFLEGDRVFLVHEFAEGANLRDALRNPINPRFTLLPSWASRLQVALDVAKGLEYLHDYAYPTYVHKFIKSNNIIIDANLRAKIAQFGVSKLTGDLETPTTGDTSISKSSEMFTSGEIQQEAAVGSARSTSSSFSASFSRAAKQRSIRITGTRGYMPPEYLSCGLVTVKYDVYAFGVVLLELLSGQEAMVFVQGARPNVYKKTSITQTISSVLEDETTARVELRKWMDPLLQDSYTLDSAYKTAQLAKSCVDPNPAFRPLMRDVALKLSKLLTGAKGWEASMAVAKSLMSGPVEAR